MCGSLGIPDVDGSGWLSPLLCLRFVVIIVQRTEDGGRQFMNDMCLSVSLLGFFGHDMQCVYM
jgi:hypothetical protein